MRQGVTVIGIGVNYDVQWLFPTALRVATVQELPSALEALFKTELVDCLTA